MSKTIDFSHLEGYPMCQDDYEYLQAGYLEALSALAAVGADGTANVATALYGMRKTSGGGSTTVTAGWFVYNGELVRFPAATLADPAGGHALYVVLTRTSGSLTFGDASTPNVVNDVTGVLTDMVDTTVAGATLFAVDDLEVWGVTGFLTDVTMGTSFGSTVANHGTPNYGAGYKVKDWNEVSLCGAIDVTVSLPGTFTLLTLPVNARPAAPIILRLITTDPAFPDLFYVSTAGVITFSTSGAATGIIYLDGVTFRLR
jgi:hypothetical protein